MTTTAGSFHPPLAKTVVAWMGAAAYLVMTACTEVSDVPEPPQAKGGEGGWHDAHREFSRMWNLPLDKLLDIVERDQTVRRAKSEARCRGLSYNPPPDTLDHDSVLKAYSRLGARLFLMRGGNEAPPGRPANVVEEIGGWQVATWHRAAFVEGSFESEAFLVVGIAMRGVPGLRTLAVVTCALQCLGQDEVATTLYCRERSISK